MELCCSYYNLCNLRWGYLTHRVTWLIHHVITWYGKKSFISTFAKAIATNFSKVWLSWIDRNHRVTWLVYHVITVYLHKGASLVSQRQWQLKLVGLWVRVKRPHLLFQVTYRSSDHVHFEKHHLSTNASHWTQLEMSNYRKTHKSKAFFVIQKISKFDSYRYTPL